LRRKRARGSAGNGSPWASCPRDPADAGGSPSSTWAVWLRTVPVVRRPAPSVVIITRLAVALAVAGVVAAIAATWAGVILADVYRPHAAELGESTHGGGRSASWSDRHVRATAVLLATTIGTAAVVGWLRYQTERRLLGPGIVTLGCSIAAAAAALVPWLTRVLVQWDHLALRSVTIASDHSGYWPAAFGDDVRHVFVGASEVSQSRYAFTLLVHLGTPMIGAAALAVVAWHLLRALRAAAPADD
jgi:hypothetical protein